MEITHRCFARVGLLGNPSDGYFGKTISFSLSNFSARVTLRPSEDIHVEPHPVHDQTHYESLEQLALTCSPSGAYGGVRLLLSLCRCFHLHCTQKRIPVPPDKRFRLSYDTDIPRQAGLSGSSAILTAGLNCLIQFFGVGDRIPKTDRPSLVLQAETEIGIVAGLQDRVIQVYGGLVYMDFDKAYSEAHGHGLYQPLPVDGLPTLYVIYCDNPSDSGKVHSTVKQRWLAGDQSVRSAMEEVATLAEQGREALLKRDYASLAILMNRNFDLRRQMFGDEALGSLNISMVETARSVGAAAKFTGSGGAVVALCPEGEGQEERLTLACMEKGFVVLKASYGEAQFQT